jgi:hypothetical protein
VDLDSIDNSKVSKKIKDNSSSTTSIKNKEIKEKTIIKLIVK